MRHPHSLTRGTLVACHRPARLRHSHSLSLYREHLHQHSRTHLKRGLLLNHSRLEPWSTSPHRFRRLHMLSQVVPRIVGTRLSQLLRRFQGLLRLSILRMSTPLRVHALPPLNHVWLLLFCPTRDRHLPRPCFLLSVMATTGAASALAEASPPSLVSCVTSRTSTRAPLWMRPLAPCSRRSNESLARLPVAVASEEWAPGSAIGAGRPVWPGPPKWVTSSWALLVLPPAARTWSWPTLKPPPRPASLSISPLLISRLASRSAFARFPQAPFYTSLPAAACA